MRFHNTERPVHGQSVRRRPERPRDDRERRGNALYADALAAIRHGDLNRARHHLGGLAVIGYAVEPFGPGFRLVDVRSSARRAS